MLRLFTKKYQETSEEKSIISLIRKENWNIYDKICVFLFVVAIFCGVWISVAFLCVCQGQNDVQYTMETNYLNWRTSLAGTTICPKELNRFKGSKTVEEFLRTVLKSEEHFCPDNCTRICSECPYQGYHSLLKKITPSCERVLRACFWNGKAFDCCKNFFPLQTPGGRLCYSLNSKLITKQSPIALKMFVTQTNNKAKLEIKLGLDSEVMVHERGTLEVHPKKVLSESVTVNQGERLKILYNVRDTKVLDSARHLVLEQRKCLFDLERFHRSQYKVYSKTACLAERAIKSQVRRCNCSHHSLHQKDNNMICGFEGLQCLNKYFKRSEMIKPTQRLMNKCPERCEIQEVFIKDNLIRNGPGMHLSYYYRKQFQGSFGYFQSPLSPKTWAKKSSK